MNSAQLGTKRPSPHQTTEQEQDINVKGAGTPHRHLLTAEGDGCSVSLAQKWTQLLGGTATLRCHVTQGWTERIQP